MYLSQQGDGKGSSGIMCDVCRVMRRKLRLGDRKRGVTLLAIH